MEIEARIANLLADRAPRTITQMATELDAPAFAIRLAVKRLGRQGRVVSAGRLMERRRSFGAPAQHWAALWTVALGS